MGIALVKAAKQSHWARVLTGDERTVLFCMASRAYDDDHDGQQAKLYWGGLDTLMLELTGGLPEHGSTAYKTRARRLKRIIAGLIEKRAIVVEKQGRGRGHRTTYRMTLYSYLNGSPVDNSLAPVKLFPRKGGTQDHLLEGGKGGR